MVDPPLLRRILDTYALNPYGLHGIGHWARVLEIARKLAHQPGVRADVLELFSVFHDARRFGDSHDPGHGPRAAIYVCQFSCDELGLDEPGHQLLQQACHGHTEGQISDDPTIGACWDSDRLDLPRAQIDPHPSLLSTPAAKDPELIRWAKGRSIAELRPALVCTEWQLINQADAPGAAD